MPMFISTLTEAQNDVINKYSDEFDIKTKSYNLSEYHRTLYIIARILKPEIVIETGVFEGHSSLALLLALKEKYLYSSLQTKLIDEQFFEFIVDIFSL